jgi:hypothetical protein
LLFSTHISQDVITCQGSGNLHRIGCSDFDHFFENGEDAEYNCVQHLRKFFFFFWVLQKCSDDNNKLAAKCESLTVNVKVATVLGSTSVSSYIHSGIWGMADEAVLSKNTCKKYPENG